MKPFKRKSDNKSTEDEKEGAVEGGETTVLSSSLLIDGRIGQSLDKHSMGVCFVLFHFLKIYDQTLGSKKRRKRLKAQEGKKISRSQQSRNR